MGNFSVFSKNKNIMQRKPFFILFIFPDTEIHLHSDSMNKQEIARPSVRTQFPDHRAAYSVFGSTLHSKCIEVRITLRHKPQNSMQFLQNVYFNTKTIVWYSRLQEYMFR